MTHSPLFLKYCDRACKVPECAMDAGDCGVQSLVEHVHGSDCPAPGDTVEAPVGRTALFVNLTSLVGSDSRITDGSHDHDELVRTATISQAHKIIIFTLHANASRVPVHVSIAWETAALQPRNASFYVVVGGLQQTSTSTSSATVASSTPHVTTTVPALDATAPGVAPEPTTFGSRRLLSIDESDALLTPSLHPMGTGEPLGTRRYPWEREAPNGYAGRRLLDVYGDSLKYVNLLFNRHFSNEARKVPAHMGHFVQRAVLQRLIDTFPAHWATTSSHVFRASDDMQFAFSYFYFLINERRAWEWPAVFEGLDADASGALDANEWRSVWVMMHAPPVKEAELVEAWNMLTANGTRALTATVLEDHDAIFAKLRKAYTALPRNPTEIRDTEDVGFVMVRNNDSSLLERLDGIRRVVAG